MKWYLWEIWTVNVLLNAHSLIKNVPRVFQSYNGNRLKQFIDTSELCLVNKLYHDVKSSTLEFWRIYYILLSENFSRQIKSAAIDDDGSLDLNSDHVVFTISLLKIIWNEIKLKKK